MSTLSEFMAQRARQGKARGKPLAPSTSPGSAVVLKGWRDGMDKVGVTRLLQQNGLRLSEAYDATDRLLQGGSVRVQLPAGTDVKALCEQLEDLGVVI